MKLKFYITALILSIATTNHLLQANDREVIASKSVAQAINQAATNGNTVKLEEFFYGGFPLNIPDAMGNTPLHNAAFYGHLNAVRFLLQHGASVDAINNELETPLHMATMEEYAESILSICLPAIASRRELRNYHGVVLALLVANALPNAQNKHGNTPLHNAGMYSPQKTAAALIAFGANPLQTNHAGMIPRKHK